MEATYSLKKGSPFINPFNKEIRKITEYGFQIKWINDIKFKNFTYDEDFFHVKISLQHMYGAFYILFFGYFFGTLLFLIEIYRIFF